MDPLAAAVTALLGLLMLGGSWALGRNRALRARMREDAARERVHGRIRFLARHASDCVILCDASGRIVEANAHCCSTYGYTRDEWPRLRVDDIVAGRRFTLPDLVQQIPADQGVVCLGRHTRRDGTPFEVEMHACPTDVDGKPCYQLLIRDLDDHDAQQRQQAEDSRRLSEMARRVVTIQEEERRRLAAELHDLVGANLATVSLNLRSLRKALPYPDPRLMEDRLKESGSLLTDTIFSIRNACNELRPAVLYYAGLVPALEELVQRANRHGELAVRFRHENMLERLPPQAEAMLFRIAQEALTNCAKHSRASKAEVRIVAQQGTITLSVADNGKGFDPARHAPDGLGLLTMRERAAMAGGTLAVTSRPGQGTQIRVTLAGPHTGIIARVLQRASRERAET